MLAIRGWSSSMAQHMLGFLPHWEQAVPVERGECNTEADRHLFCNGLIGTAPASKIGQGDRMRLFEANCGMVMHQCDRILSINDKARIVVIGSDSAFKGSHDDTYGAAKAGLHHYVETKRLRTPGQQLVCVAPSIIEDSRMTQNREDRDNLIRRREAHPKKRFLTMSEVCRMIEFLLYTDEGYTSGCVIRMNGGVQ